MTKATIKANQNEEVTVVNEEVAATTETAVAVSSTENFFESMPALRNMPVSKRIQALKMVTSYQGAESTKVDKWINKEMPVIGVAFHKATVKQTVKKVNDDTGELFEVEEMVDEIRTVFKLQDFPAVALVSKAAYHFVSEMLIPVLGFGDWIDEDGQPIVVSIIPHKVSSGQNQTYNFQVV